MVLEPVVRPVINPVVRAVQGSSVGVVSPGSLFPSGTQGVWYDPSDASTLFSDTAGTTPCPTPGGGTGPIAVGLMLDKSQGLALGSEIVVNGNFATNTDWTDVDTGTGVSTISGGVLTLVGPDGSNRAGRRQAITTVVGRSYVLTGSVVNTSGTSVIAATNDNVNFPPLSILSASVNATRPSVIFQATATTTYIVAYTSPAGNSIIDNISVKELAGNHAIRYGGTTTAPELSARVNLLTYSEQFDDAVWTKDVSGTPVVSISANSTTAPDGTVTADTLTELAVTNFHRIAQSFTFASGVTYTCSVYVKNASGSRYVGLSPVGSQTAGNNCTAVFDLPNKSYLGVQTAGSVLVGSVTSPTITELANGWFRLSLSFSATTGGAGGPSVWLLNTFVNNGISQGSYTGDGTSGIFIWGADLRPANIGANIPSYQRIADQYTYDSNGFPRYLKFDGADDGMYTPASIPFATVTSDGQARRNLLTYPTQFDDPAWTKTGFLAFGSGSVANTTATLDPAGGNTADLLVEDSATSFHSATSSTASGTSGTTYTLSRYIKAGAGSRWIALALSEAVSNHVAFAHFQPSTNTIGVFGTSGAQWTSVAFTRTDAGNGWYRLVLTATLTNAATLTDQSRFKVVDNGPSSYAGDGTSSMYWWGAQLETGSTATAFQNIGTNQMTVFAGVRKLSDATFAPVTELSSAPSSNNGTFGLFAPFNNTQQNYGVSSRGTTNVTSGGPASGVGSIPAPSSNVLALQGNIAAPLISLRVNGAAYTSNTSTQGTGNYDTYPLYIGSRNNASNWFNGYIYSLLVVGSSLSAAQISSTESWIAGKEGITL